MVHFQFYVRLFLTLKQIKITSIWILINVSHISSNYTRPPQHKLLFFSEKIQHEFLQYLHINTVIMDLQY